MAKRPPRPASIAPHCVGLGRRNCGLRVRVTSPRLVTRDRSQLEIAGPRLAGNVRCQGTRNNLNFERAALVKFPPDTGLGPGRRALAWPLRGCAAGGGRRHVTVMGY